MEQDIIDLYSGEAIPTQVITIDRPECQELDSKNNIIFVSNNNDTDNNVEPSTTDSTTTKTTTNTNNTITTTTTIILSPTTTTTTATTNTNTSTSTITTTNDNEDKTCESDNINDDVVNTDDNTNTNSTSNNTHSKSGTRFKWTKEKSQVAMNLVQHGCKPRLVSVAVGCSLRTAQKFVETVTPKMEGELFKNYEIRRRGRKSKDVNQRLNAIREVLSRDSNITQAEIAADLKVSNTTVCRDLKRMGTTWREKKSDQSNNMKLENKKDRATRKNIPRAKQKKTNSARVENETIDTQLFK